MKKKFRLSRGLTIVEVLLAISIALVFLVGVNQLVSIGLAASEQGRLRSTAAQLASQGIEAMYNIRENNGINFTSGWSGLTVGSEYYQPTLSGSAWSLGTKKTLSPPASLSSPYNRFTRTVKIEAVRRTTVGLGCSGPVNNAGTCDDPNTRKITVTVTWVENNTVKTHKTVSLLTNI